MPAHVTAVHDQQPESVENLPLYRTRDEVMRAYTPVTHEERAAEFLLMGLRLAEGIDPSRYAAIAGRPLDGERIKALAALGFVESSGEGCLRVTPAGFPVLDAVVADLAA